MTAKEFYDKRLEEDSTIGSVQLMNEYARLITEKAVEDHRKVISALEKEFVSTYHNNNIRRNTLTDILSRIKTLTEE